MIPKILHQIWIGGKPIPQKFITWRGNWRKLHPDWDYRLWTDNDVKELVDIKKYVDEAHDLSSKSNIIRAYVVMKYGGVYSDMDVDWNKNIDEFLILNAFVSIEINGLCCGAIFGAEANNKWIIYQISQFNNYYRRDPPWGSKLMTEAYKKFKEYVTVLPSYYFYPYSYHELYKDASMFPDSYAVHHWDKLWARQQGNECVIENMIHDIVKKNSSGLVADEYRYIAYKLEDINFLIFGTGYDSDLWRYSNKSGTTLFLEDNPKYIINLLDTIQIKYTCNIKDYKKLLIEFDAGDYTNLIVELPKKITDIKWDFIFVNSPTGDNNNCHGRMQSIFAAYTLATPTTQIFIHDCDREVEDLFSKRMFKTINQIIKLRHCVK